MNITKELLEELRSLKQAKITPEGEMLNPTRMFVPGEEKRLTLQQRIQRVLRSELSKQAAEQDMETFEESQDFDVDGEFDMPEPESEYALMEEEYLPEKVVDPEPAKPVEESTPEKPVKEAKEEVVPEVKEEPK